MNPSRLLLALALTLFGHATTRAQSFPLWGGLQPGAYTVGYRAAIMHDRSRIFIPERNYEGRIYKGERSRPLLIQIFYPAEGSSNSARMAYRDYLSFTGTTPAAATVAKGLRQRTEGIHDFYQGRYLEAYRTGLYERLMSMQTAAVRDAPAAKGRFPVIIYGGGAGLSTDENIVLWEFLASHGYVVAVVPMMGANSVTSIADAAGLENLTRDMEFLFEQVQELPNADTSRVGAMGFSYGGQAALLMAMRNSDVKAVVGLDPSFIGSHYSRFLKSSPFYNADNVTVPVLELHRKDEKTVTYDVTGALKYSERYSFEIEGLDHFDFANFAQIYTGAMPEQAKRSSPVASRKAAYESMSRYILDFLDSYLKAEQSRSDALKKPVEWAGYPRQAVNFRYLAALPAPPSYSDLLEIFRERGAVRGEQIYREVLKRDSNAGVISEQSINNLGYALMESGKIDEALRVLQLNAERFPRSANVYDSLADAYKQKGDRPCAAYAYRKLLEVLSQDASLDESSRTNFQRTATEQLQKLRAAGVTGECEPGIK
ncbi:MAG TPA: dienelactone hydrolase family protein [Pyrinomonadaceae bacterium]|nr:dienelactone hydrolase family protein [Pyrinomonadaceae bacterium]